MEKLGKNVGQENLSLDGFSYIFCTIATLNLRPII